MLRAMGQPAKAFVEAQQGATDPAEAVVEVDQIGRRRDEEQPFS